MCMCMWDARGQRHSGRLVGRVDGRVGGRVTGRVSVHAFCSRGEGVTSVDY